MEWAVCVCVGGGGGSMGLKLCVGNYCTLDYTPTPYPIFGGNFNVSHAVSGDCKFRCFCSIHTFMHFAQCPIDALK